MLTRFRNSRRLQCVAVLLAGVLLVGFAHVPILREMEAARLFAQGWAPKVIVIPGALWEEQQALSELGISVPESWEISRESSVRVQQKTLMTIRDIADTILKA